MGAIDAHTHAFPDELARRAVTALEEAAQWRAVGDGKVSDLVESMDAADVDVSVVCTIATNPNQTTGIFKWCRNIRSNRIDPFPSVHPETRNVTKWLERIANARFSGIKLHPMYQNFAFDDPGMDEMYKVAADRRLVIAVHCGRDIAFPPDDDRASPQRIRRVVERFANLKLICTHLGGWKDWDAVEEHLLGTGVYLETSFSIKLLGNERAANLIRRHGTDRVLFGSDWPWSDQGQEIRRVRSLGFSESETWGILFTNAAKLLGY